MQAHAHERLTHRQSAAHWHSMGSARRATSRPSRASCRAAVLAGLWRSSSPASGIVHKPSLKRCRRATMARSEVAIRVHALEAMPGILPHCRRGERRASPRLTAMAAAATAAAATTSAAIPPATAVVSAARAAPVPAAAAAACAPAPASTSTASSWRSPRWWRWWPHARPCHRMRAEGCGRHGSGWVWGKRGRPTRWERRV